MTAGASNIFLLATLDRAKASTASSKGEGSRVLTSIERPTSEVELIDQIPVAGWQTVPGAGKVRLVR